ncbi:MAG: hypothetical protein J7K00_00880 [Candidatus Diapherotrites archaeon]|nr:hypothetical protein [Candidatus Diapherotrites archaeon]
MEKMNNFRIDESKRHILVSIDPSIYPLPVITLAANDFVNNYFVMLDGDVENEILVSIRQKEDKEISKDVGETFNNKLIEYSVFVEKTIRNQALRESLTSLALTMSNALNNQDSTRPASTEICKEIEEESKSYLDDPNGITKPWRPPK